MSELVSREPICVTGASGFIAAQLVADLLAAGYRVRGTVRDASAPDKYRFLTELPGATDRLELVSANLLEPSSFAAAVAGCEYVHHVASPYIIDVKDPQRDLVDPAVNGTLGVLEACERAGSVRRVVLTSSMAALTDEPDETHTLTEDDWNETSSLKRNPYYYSKTLAERAAWRFVEERAPSFDLVVINPFMVIGPSLSESLNESNRVIADLFRGRFPGIVSLAWGFVDVRDVARAHQLGMERPAAAGRYVCAADTLSMREVVATLRELGYGHYKLPKLGLEGGFGRFLVRTTSYFYGRGTGSYLRSHLGRRPVFDNGKIRRDLGLTFRPVADSLRDAVDDLQRWGHIPRRDAPAAAG